MLFCRLFILNHSLLYFPFISSNNVAPVSGHALVVYTIPFFLFSELGTAYVSATTGAVATALGLNALTKVLRFLFP